jgi:hypothetical protein
MDHVMTLVAAACAATLAALSLLAAYQWLLAAASVWGERPHPEHGQSGQTRFLVLVPAHDEEAGLPATLRSLDALEYAVDRYQVVVVADRCADGTAAAARRGGSLCLEREGGPAGKGAAIAWALDTLSGLSAPFDAVVVLDADTLAHPGLLAAFERGLRAGHQVQQGYNDLANPWESAFTRVIAVTSTLRNRLFYGGKARLGLSAMLTGTGMCFARALLERHRWDAFSVGEDWEFSASLLLHGERIRFNRDAKVFARESLGFRQASPQRLRWASGRHAVAATGGRALLAAGVRQRSLALCDAALTLAAPTYSLQAALALGCLALAALAPGGAAWPWLAPWAAGVAALLALYFLAGAALTAAPLRALGGIALIPAFLPWRVAVEVLGLLGYGRGRWVRTRRLPATR